MKKNVKFLLLTAFVGGSLCLTTGCGNASRYADDVWRTVDDKIDDGIKIKPPKIKKAPKQKICGNCHGTGVVYDAYWNQYECSNCGGDGEVWIDL